MTDPELLDDPFARVAALEDLRERTFKTPAAGRSARPFTVDDVEPDALEVRTSRGGTVTLRCEAFAAAVKVVKDLGEVEPEGWVRIGDETLVAVLQAENRDKACTSYVLPLLEAAGLLELERARPARVRLQASSQ